ncbi:hypothetical protein [Curtobacterium aetherium]|uniref:Uncharacterized protein n=1 Tax=Curtobacterium aetherium TaxID=2841594 RepID=A0ACD1E7M6_9MICO|nr:hypothetical protein [Curtobacterium sp. L6-1]QWS34652.1 hypothetical protein KM842_05820 [Curtobacterium sp. L6-1]
MRLEVFGKLSEFLWPLLQETFDVLDDPHGNSEVALRDDPCCDTQADRGFVAFNEIAHIFQRLNSEPILEFADDAECLTSVIATVVHREFFDVLVGNPDTGRDGPAAHRHGVGLAVRLGLRLRWLRVVVGAEPRPDLVGRGDEEVGR